MPLTIHGKGTVRAARAQSTGKELSHLGRLRDATAGFRTLPVEDVVATLTMLTARTVADAVRSVGATEVIVSGGGTRNPVLMRMLECGCRGGAAHH